MLYKVLKQGFYSEPHLNEVGKIVDLAPDVAENAVRKGFLELYTGETPSLKAKVEKKTKKGRK